MRLRLREEVAQAAGGIGLRVLTGQGAAIDTTTAAGKLVFGIFATLAEFERELITEPTRAGLASAAKRFHSLRSTTQHRSTELLTSYTHSVSCVDQSHRSQRHANRSSRNC